MGYKKLLSDDANIKLIILFSLDTYQKPATNSDLTEIILKELSIDYFALQQNLYELVKDKKIKLTKEAKKEYYEITPAGAQVIGFFEHKIPYSLKEKITFAVSTSQKVSEPTSTAKADYTVLDNGEFLVNMEITEKGIPLFQLGLNVGSRELALRAKEMFEKNPQALYQKIAEEIMRNI